MNPLKPIQSIDPDISVVQTENGVVFLGKDLIAGKKYSVWIGPNNVAHISEAEIDDGDDDDLSATSCKAPQP